ncbi:hypothetical protein [Actinophytocola sediminis]
MAAKDLIFTVLGIDRASDTFDKVGGSMDKMSRVGTKSMAALLGASLGSSAGIAAAVSGIGVVFAATAAVALSGNAEVAQSYRDLGATIKTDLAADAAVLQDEFVGAADQINASFQSLRPQMQDAFSAAQPHIESLVDGVTGFAEEAMPGMVTAVERAGPVFDGLEDFLESSGRATGDFFTVISEGSPAAGMALSSLGDLMEGVLPNVGQMLVNLSGLWADNGDQTVRVINDIISVVTELSSGALPVVSDAFGIALDVLEAVLNVIQPITDQLGPMIGMWLSLSLAMRAVDGVRGVADRVGSSVGKMSDRMSGVQGAGQKMATGVGGILNLLGGPWAFAVAGATAVLALFGQESQRNAQDQKSLAQSLLESNGAFDTQARQVLRDSQQYQDLSRYIKDVGLSEREYLDAVIQGGPALDAQQQRLADLAHGQRVASATSQEARDKAIDQAEAAKQLHYRTENLVGMISAARAEFEREQEVIGGVTASMAGAEPGADALAEAMKVLGDETASTADRANALNTAWMRLLGIPVSLEEATSGFEEGLDAIRTHLDQVKAGTDNWKGALLAADGQVILSTEQGRQLSTALIGQGNDYRTLAQTVYDTTLQRTGSEQAATAAVRAAATDRRGQFIAEMRQMGFNAGEAQRLANRYLGLPDDVLTLIRATAGGAQAVVDGFVNRNDGRTISMTLTIDQIPSGRSPWARALGGPIKPYEMYEVGEHGRELFISDQAGMIIPHNATERFLSSVRDGNATPMSLGGGSMPRAGGAGRGGRVVVEFRGSLAQLLRNQARVIAGGDVQLAFGGSR